VYCSVLWRLFLICWFFGVQVFLSDRTGRVSWNFIVVPLVLPVPVRWRPLLFLVIVELNADGDMLQGNTCFSSSLHFLVLFRLWTFFGEPGKSARLFFRSITGGGSAKSESNPEFPLQIIFYPNFIQPPAITGLKKILHSSWIIQRSFSYLFRVTLIVLGTIFINFSLGDTRSLKQAYDMRNIGDKYAFCV